MKVEVFSLLEKELPDYEMRDVVEVRIDGETVFSVYDSEPEDATLENSFKDCYRVGQLMQQAYEAGQKGESFVLIEEKVSGDILWDYEKKDNL